MQAAIRMVLAAAAVAILLSCSHAFPPSKAPLPPREAAAAIKVPDGFKVTLFAGEPDVSHILDPGSVVPATPLE